LTMAPSILELARGYVLPGLLMIGCGLFFLKTAIVAPQLPFKSFKAYRDRSFAAFWLLAGKNFAKEVPKELDSILATSCRGVVLDVGPGAGDQLFRYPRSDNITVMYGAEPGVDMHGALQENAKRAGLGGKYKILACGAEPESLFPALDKEGLLGKDKGSASGVFDTIVCLRVLCGVPNPEGTIQGLYRLLKPGGRIVVFEHVENNHPAASSKASRFFQHLYMGLGYSFLTGGCCLTRDTGAMLVKAAEKDGGWAEVQLGTVDEWSTIPHIFGYLTKKR